MSTRPVTYYQEVCDFPDCGDVNDGGEYSAWSDAESARDDAVAADWHEGPEGSNDMFCCQHPAVWATDVQEDRGPVMPRGAKPEDPVWPALLLDDVWRDDAHAVVVAGPDTAQALVANWVRLAADGATEPLPGVTPERTTP